MEFDRIVQLITTSSRHYLPRYSQKTAGFTDINAALIQYLTKTWQILQILDKNWSFFVQNLIEPIEEFISSPIKTL
jgi:hypothetical protein